jgi:diacylglycerol kinase
VKRLVYATIHSLQGLRYTIVHETAVRLQVVLLCLAVPLAFSSPWVRLGMWPWSACLSFRWRRVVEYGN